MRLMRRIRVEETPVRKGHMRICGACAVKIGWWDVYVPESKRPARCGACGKPEQQTIDIEEGRYRALKEGLASGGSGVEDTV